MVSNESSARSSSTKPRTAKYASMCSWCGRRSWLSQRQMATIFQTSTEAVSFHPRNIYSMASWSRRQLPRISRQFEPKGNAGFGEGESPPCRPSVCARTAGLGWQQWIGE